MIRRVLFLVVASLALAAAGLLLLADTTPARMTFAQYQAAILRGDVEQAAALVSAEVLAFEEKTRGRALDASESDVLALPTVEAAAVLGMRDAVHSGGLGADELRRPKNPRALHAALRRAIPGKTMADVALLAIVPTGLKRATAWVGPRAFAGDAQMLAFSIMSGLRVNLVEEGGSWRVDYMPAMHASAAAHDAIGAAAPAGSQASMRKQAFNTLFAHGNVAKQKALWEPLGRSANP